MPDNHSVIVLHPERFAWFWVHHASNETSSRVPPDVGRGPVSSLVTPDESTNKVIRFASDILRTTLQNTWSYTCTDVTLLTRDGQEGRRVESPLTLTVLWTTGFHCVRPPVLGLRRLRDGAVNLSTQTPSTT